MSSPLVLEFANSSGNPKKSFVKRMVTEDKPCPQMKKLLMSLVRTGSYQSLHNRFPTSKSQGLEDQMDALNINSSNFNSIRDLQAHCLKQCRTSPVSKISYNRQFVDIDTISNADSEEHITVLQWNILSQALGVHCDKFATCSTNDLDWSTRKWKIIYEILQFMPVDVICLQEVDHFEFLLKILQKIGFDGRFVPKPDSPCYYMSENSGPDGCAMFYNKSRLSLVSSTSRVLQVYACESNQVALSCLFRIKSTGKKFAVATTHLKARKGPVLSSLRNEQGKDLLKHLFQVYPSLPLIVTGDFNADPKEPVYCTLTSQLSSAYPNDLLGEPSFTNWTRREGEEETKQTVDYIFYTNSQLQVVSLLNLTCKDMLHPFPNAEYPSDHLSLASKFQLL